MNSADELFPRLANARRTVLLLLLAAAAVAGSVTMVAWIGTADRAVPARCVRALALSTLCFAPAGTAARCPAAVHAAVDLRFVPGAPGSR
ncbi:MAG: hypothetical protein IT455_05685 [Planctomycetes bacterium]|nr:hypothetical protein [Planctomycetota bacterium]